MLILNRKKRQAIHIGKDIKILILDVGASTVKIGIEAPRDIEVHRDEIYRKIEENDATIVDSYKVD